MSTMTPTAEQIEKARKWRDEHWNEFDTGNPAPMLAAYAAYQAGEQTQAPSSCQGLVEAGERIRDMLNDLRIKQQQMLDQWAEGSPAKQADLWRRLHENRADCVEAVMAWDAMTTENKASAPPASGQPNRYRSAVSGMWYENIESAGAIDAVSVNGAVYPIAPSPVEVEQEPDAYMSETGEPISKTRHQHFERSKHALLGYYSIPLYRTPPSVKPSVEEVMEAVKKWSRNCLRAMPTTDDEPSLPDWPKVEANLRDRLTKLFNTDTPKR